MNLVIVHYHLNPGGVTRVIANQLLALDSTATEPLRAFVLHGPGDDGWPAAFSSSLQRIECRRETLPCLGYADGSESSADEVLHQLLDSLKACGCDPATTVVQVHNHCLGKNAALTQALPRLNAAGFRLLLQIHDFAEDFRPANYHALRSALGTAGFGAAMYPQSGSIHYAVLSRRDWSVLRAAGVSADRLHFLPNPVLPLGPLPDRESSRQQLEQFASVPLEARLLTCPVRGIRRKNIGELLLWATLLERQAWVALTLAPRNPIERVAYDDWVQFAQTHQLAVAFDTAAGLTFEQNLAAADWIVSTSVTEGFGMVFLESWLAGRGFAGRDLPDVTADFVEAGVKFDQTYDRLPIPVEWIDVDDYLERLRSSLDQLHSDYRLPELPPDQWERIAAEKTRDQSVDFADLDQPLQQQVIERVIRDASARQRLLDEVPVFERTLVQPDEQLVSTNQQQVEESYSLAPSGKRLTRLLESVLHSDHASAEDELDAERVLRTFLDGRRIRLIRQ